MIRIARLGALALAVVAAVAAVADGGSSYAADAALGGVAAVGDGGSSTGRGLAAAVADGGSSEARGLCASAALVEGEIAQHEGGRWMWLSRDQRLFLAGIYAMNPATPPGLPFGDRAAMAIVPENAGALILFIDGDQACTPMPVPTALLDMLRDIAAGVVHHQGDRL